MNLNIVAASYEIFLKHEVYVTRLNYNRQFPAGNGSGNRKWQQRNPYAIFPCSCNYST